MGYQEAADTILNLGNLSTFLMVIIAILVLFLLGGQAFKLWRDLFGKPKEDSHTAYQRHCQESAVRFERGERHIEENHKDILDLREGQRVTCIASLALLNHAIHNGNDKEMKDASAALNSYLINRK